MNYDRDTKRIKLSLAEINALTAAEELLFSIGKLSPEGTDLKVMAYKASQDIHTIRYYARTKYYIEMEGKAK